MMSRQDEAGERFATSLGKKHTKPKEPFKDWNEELVIVNNKL